jgi:hypothetical protein
MYIHVNLSYLALSNTNALQFAMSNLCYFICAFFQLWVSLWMNSNKLSQFFKIGYYCSTSNLNSTYNNSIYQISWFVVNFLTSDCLQLHDLFFSHQLEMRFKLYHEKYQHVLVFKCVPFANLICIYTLGCYITWWINLLQSNNQIKWKEFNL